MDAGAQTPHCGEWLCAKNAFWCCSCRLSRVTVIPPAPPLRAPTALLLSALLAVLPDAVALVLVPLAGSGRKLCCDGFAGSFGAKAMRSFVYWFSYEYSPGLLMHISIQSVRVSDVVHEKLASDTHT